MKRQYNHKVYGKFQKMNAVIRNKCSPNPTESLNVFGVIGKIFGFIINKIIAFPIHLVSFAITSLLYNKRKDSPYKGSIIYTFVRICLMFVVAGIIALLVKQITKGN